MATDIVEVVMPLVQVSIPAGSLSAEQKRALIAGITDAVVEVEGPAVRRGTWVHVTEVPDGGWGMGGRAFTLAELAAQVAAAQQRA
jgi:4-oxalocrotonate tautomerase